MTTPITPADALLDLLRRRGALPAAEVQQALQVSRATLSRAVARSRGRVLRLGAARATVYATPLQRFG